MDVQYLITGDTGLLGAATIPNKRALVGAVTGNRWWVSLKHRIRDFATKYGRQLNLDRTKEAKSVDDRLSREVAGGTP